MEHWTPTGIEPTDYDDDDDDDDELYTYMFPRVAKCMVPGSNRFPARCRLLEWLSLASASLEA